MSEERVTGIRDRYLRGELSGEDVLRCIEAQADAIEALTTEVERLRLALCAIDGETADPWVEQVVAQALHPDEGEGR